MLQFEELRLELNDNKQKLFELREALGLDALKEEIAKLEEQTAAEEFWGDIENSQKVLQRISQLKNKVANYTSLETAFDDTMTLIELADEEEDLSMFDECREGVTKFEDELEKQTLSTLLNGEYDAKNALLTFHAGAGGTEAQDWTQMLVRMYQHWGEKHDFKVSMLDFLDGDEAGLKSAVLLVEGENAYGYLKGEMGVHRLVRVSPFDSSAAVILFARRSRPRCIWRPIPSPMLSMFMPISPSRTGTSGSPSTRTIPRQRRFSTD